MPELPDVEGQRRYFRRHARGKSIRAVGAERDIVRNSSASGLGRSLKGRRFVDPRRHGKWLICPTDGPVLVFHFGMTGELVWAADKDPKHPHDRATLVLDDGELRYRAMRKLGGVWLALDDGAVADVLGPVGPDAHRLSRSEFLDVIDGRKGSVKPALMNQELIAGLGNLTADEALWRARIAPTRAVSSLDEKERVRLYAKIQKVLRDSIRVGHVPGKKSWLTGARAQEDARCPRCRSRLRSARVGGRTTYWCPRCQPD